MNSKNVLKSRKTRKGIPLLCLFFLLCFVPNIQAQKMKVEGIVTGSEDGMPIPGVSVVLKGTKKGVATDFDGKYSIKAKSGDFLIFSYLGMEEQTIKITNKKLNVSMVSNLEGLEEVVVIGYGTQKKKELTGAVNRIKAEDIGVTVTSDLSTALQGQVAGVSITPSSEAGGAASILIRGLSSAEGNNTPLFVVDGVPQLGDPQLSPNDVESIDILKDAASASIYGSRGAAGVILITTKRAEEGKLKIRFDATKGVNKIISGLPYMDAAEYQYYTSIRTNTFNHPGNSTLFNDSNMVDVVENDYAPSSTYSINLSGGTKAQSYSISGGVFDQESNIINSNFKRYNVRANAILNTGRFSFSPGVSLQYENGNSVPNSFYKQALSYSPLAPDLEPGQLEVWSSTTNGAVIKDIYGALKALNTNVEKSRTRSSFKNRTKIDITDGLSFVSNIGYTQDIVTEESYTQKLNLWKPNKNDLTVIERANQNGIDGNLKFVYYKQSKLLVDGALNFSKKYGNHKVQALALFSVEDDMSSSIGVSRSEFNITTDGRTPLISEGSGIAAASHGNGLATQRNYHIKSIGMVGRILYDYKGKYLLNVSVRRDGSSKFIQENKWKTFPSVSVGWNVSQEDFWTPVKSVVNNYKIRVSQGTTGSDRIRPDSSYSLVTYGDDYSTSTGDRVQGGTLRIHANPASKWETTKQLNIGQDFGFFKNKFTASVDYYITTKSDMLFPLQSPPSIGGGSVKGRSQLNFNVGDMENQGVEWSVGYNNRNKEFKWSLDANYYANTNKVTRIYEGIESITSSTGVSNSGGRYSTLAVGREAGSYFLFKTDGVINDADELAEYKANVSSINGFDPELGFLKYVDSNEDGVIDDRDRVYSGSSQPDFEIGFRTKFSYKNFDLSTQWQAVVGTSIINQARNNAYSEERHKDLVYMWSESNPTSNIPKFVSSRGGHPNLQTNTDYWLEDGDFIRLNNFTLGYSVPKKTIQKIGLSRFRLFFTAQNALIFTDYTGYSPQVSGSVTRAGVDDGRKPISSLYSFGLNVNF